MSESATVVYHHEEGTWWAESEQAPGFTAVADSIQEVRSMVQKGLPLAGWNGAIREELEGGAVLVSDINAISHQRSAWAVSYKWAQIETPNAAGSPAATTSKQAISSQSRVFV